EESRYSPSEPLQEMIRLEWQEFTRDTFESVFGLSALKRTGFDGLMRNTGHVRQSQSGDKISRSRSNRVRYLLYCSDPFFTGCTSSQDFLPQHEGNGQKGYYLREYY